MVRFLTALMKVWATLICHKPGRALQEPKVTGCTLILVVHCTSSFDPVRSGGSRKAHGLL